MPRKPSQIAAERARNKRTKTITVRLRDPEEVRYMEVLRHDMRTGSAPETLKALFIREIVKRGIDMK